MTEALTVYEALPLYADGTLNLALDLSWEDWKRIGETLHHMERNVQWWLGDWWNFGQRTYGEMASQEAKDNVLEATGKHYDTIRAAAWVAEQFDPVRRRTDLSWSHHREVAGLPAPLADKLLDKASDEGWSSHETRAEVERVAGRTHEHQFACRRCGEILEG